MSRASINFERLASELTARSHEFVPRWITGGKQRGNEYRAATINGGDGDSFSINLLTGKWADFATNQTGGDLISLYAEIHNLSNYESAKVLAEMIGFQEDLTGSNTLPNLNHSMYGPPVAYWAYHNKKGLIVALVARYKDGDKKQFTQWRFNFATQKWEPKALESDRPLYNLHILDKYPSKKVLICEGEKAAVAAQKLVGEEYIATCWSSGSTAIAKTDFSPLNNRDVVLWPDNDDAGKKAMEKLALKISMNVNSLAILNPKPEDPQKFDAFDLLEKAPKDAEFIKYINDRFFILKAAPSTKKNVVALDDEKPLPNVVSGVALPYDEDSQEYELANSAGVSRKWKDFGLMMKTETKVYQNEANIVKILTSQEPTVYYDEFFKSYMNTYQVVVPEKFNDITFIRYKLYFQKTFRFGDVSGVVIENSLAYVASQTVKNDLASKLNSLEWDRKPRINDFFKDIYGVEDSEYTSATSRIFWLSMVARILKPSVKADIMVILEGDQGIQKSTSLEEIGDIFNINGYSVSGKKLDNKDFYINLAGKFIVEMAEINVLLKNSDEDIKEMLSTREDHYRIPYAKGSQAHSRTNIFVGTTNQENYLRDETGARRFLPVKCNKVDFELLRENKMQYFAEAVHRLNAGEDHWLFPKDAAKEQTDARMETDDPWTDQVDSFCRRIRYVRVSDVLSISLGLQTYQQGRRESNRVVKILRRLGYRSCIKREKDAVFKCWELTDSVRDKKSWEL